jgi:hypothetical protein
MTTRILGGRAYTCSACMVHQVSVAVLPFDLIRASNIPLFPLFYISSLISAASESWRTVFLAWHRGVDRGLDLEHDMIPVGMPRSKDTDRHAWEKAWTE